MNETRAAGEMALAMANLARRCVGPEGTVFRVDADDASLVRSTFITRLAEAAMKILEDPTR